MRVILTVLTVLTLLFYSQFSYAKNLVAYSSIAPLSYVVSAVVGDKLDVKTVLPDGKAPSTFQPSLKMVSEAQSANLLFVLDVTFEKNLVGKLKGIRGVKVVNVGAGVPRREMKTAHHHDHDHGHSHDNHFKDPHYWLSPKNLEIMAKNIFGFMKSFDKTNEEFYKQRLQSFIEKTKKVRADLKVQLSNLKGGKLYVFHPSFGYFLDAYGIDQVSVEVDGKVPTAKYLSKLMMQAKRDKVTHIFSQPQFSVRPVNIVASKIGATVYVLNPLERDVLDNLSTMGRKIKEALK